MQKKILGLALAAVLAGNTVQADSVSSQVPSSTDLNAEITNYTKAISLNSANADAYYNRGIIYAQQHRDDLAQADFQRAITLRPLFANAYGRLGWLLIERGQFAQALPYCQKAYQLDKTTYDWVINLGHSYLLKGDAKTARNYYQEALILIDGNPASFEQGPLADFNLFIKNGWQTFAVAAEKQWMLENFVKMQPNLQKISELEKLVKAYYQKRNYEDAQQIGLEVLALREQSLGKNHFMVARSLIDLANAYYSQGKYTEAAPLFLRSLAIREAALGKDHPEVAENLNGLAALYKEQGKYAEAEALFLRSLAIREKIYGKDDPDVAASLSNLAVIYRLEGKYDQAESLYLRGLAIDEKAFGKEHSNVAIDLNNLALLYKVQGKYEQAEPLYLRSLAIYEKALGEENPHVAETLNNLAELYRAQNSPAKAEPLYVKSLEIFEKTYGKDHFYVAASLNSLAVLYSSQAKYEQAEPLYLRSLAIAENVLGPDHPIVGSFLNNLAEFYHEQGKYQQAEPLYLRSLAIAEKTLGKEHPDVGNVLNNLSGLYQDQGKYSQAEPLRLRCLTIDEKVLGKNHPKVAYGLDNLGLLYSMQGKYQQAEPLFQRSLRIMNHSLNHWLWGAGEKTRQAYLQKEQGVRNLYLSFYSLRNAAAEAFYFSLSRKGVLLRISSEVSSLAKQSADPVIKKQTREFNALKMQLASLAFSGKADKADIQALEEKSNQLEMQLSQKVAGFKRSKTEVTPNEVLAKLKPEQTVIDFLVYTERDLKTGNNKTEQVIALLADKQNGIKLIKLGELAPISEAIKTYRQNILPNAQGQLANREDALKPASQKLYQLIWQPLSPYLNNKKQIYLIPDGILHLLPFKALQDKQGHYLAETKQITLLTSARDIVLPPLAGKANDSVIFAAPVFGEKEGTAGNTPTRSVVANRGDIYFAPLEGAAAEGKALSDLIKTRQAVQVFQDKQATETSVAALKSPRLLHFATHGFFLENIKPVETQNFASLPSASAVPVANIENPLTRSGLALTGANFGIAGKKQADGTDGILTALEVLGLHLEGTDLVTLSACETSVGEIQVGEGVYSLNRAFQEAGAKSVLSTLWSVADEQTKRFMQEFYTLVLNGESPQQALQKTQLKFINDKNLQDPFFWAAFTVVGI